MVIIYLIYILHNNDINIKCKYFKMLHNIKIIIKICLFMLGRIN